MIFRRSCGRALLLCGAALNSYAQAPDPVLSMPADCAIGRQCVMQNYVDHDAGPGARDYRCGYLTNDGHKGTDIRVTNAALMSQGVRVMAAAAGRVRATRDGMADVSFRETGTGAVAGREAGNSVVIEHGDGWETQYAHLRKGSVAVRPGDMVKRGQLLGLIGLSGLTEFPHVHFEVRLNGKTVDPFVGAKGGGECESGTQPLWDAPAEALLKYTPTGVLATGFAGVMPDTPAGITEDAMPPRTDAPVLIFWIRIFGARGGDEEHLSIRGPDGKILAESRKTVPGNKAEWFSLVGSKRRDAPWAAGTYRGEYTLRRADGGIAREALEIAREFTIAP